jgi:uncharacterized protein (TIGR02145 family)
LSGNVSPGQIIWNWSVVAGAAGYRWNTTTNYASSVDLGGSTTKTETGLACYTPYIRYVWAYNSCGISAPTALTQSTPGDPPAPPFEGSHIPSSSQIIWKWNPGSMANGYKWSTTNNYATATDMGTSTSKTESGLICNTSYQRFVWTYSSCGNSSSTILTKSTSVDPPAAPTAGTHLSFASQITWNWYPVPGSTSYKWNTTSDYNTAIDIGTNTSKTEIGLIPNTNYSRYIWACSACGNSGYSLMSQSTSVCTCSGDYPSIYSSDITNPLCFGSDEGSISIVVIDGTPPYSFLWSNGATSRDISGLYSGFYSVTISDANCCQVSESWFIAEPSPLVISGTVVAPSNYGACDGEVYLTVTGGFPPYFYLWSNGSSQNNIISGLCSGLYSVTVTDFNGCTHSESWCVGGGCPWSCGQQITDLRDGKSYNTVQIGSQCWMAQNMNLGIMMDSTINQTDNDISEKYCYKGMESNCDIYGGLYQWWEAMLYDTVETSLDIQGICPDGWRIPKNQDWLILENHLGGVDVAGGKMKDTGTSHWLAPNYGASNMSGFTGLGAGRHVSGPIFYFENIRIEAYFWSSTITVPHFSWIRRLEWGYDNLYSVGEWHFTGLSVRCLKD